MKTNNHTTEDLLKQSRDSIQVPSREAFRGMLASVTKQEDTRNRGQEGVYYHNVPSPYHQFMRNKIVVGILAAGAALALIIAIVPRNPVSVVMPANQYQGQNQNSTAIQSQAVEQSAQQYGVVLPPANSTSQIDLAVRDILTSGIEDAQAAQVEQYQDGIPDDTAAMNDLGSYQI